jgi:type I restriction enzyme, R subunit
MTPNQNPEQLARDQIDAMLIAVVWLIHSKKPNNIKAAARDSVGEYHFDILQPSIYLPL